MKPMTAAMVKSGAMTLAATCLDAASPHAAGIPYLSLTGEWTACVDEADVGLKEQWFAAPLKSEKKTRLPGSLAQSGLGNPYNPESGRYDGFPKPPYLKWPAAGYTDDLQRDELHTLVASHLTLAPAWFEREFEVPEAQAGKPLKFKLGRVKWTSRCWINGKEVPARVNDSLHTPHEYRLSDGLAAGHHRLTLRIDSRPHLNIGIAGHGYGMETEGLWLGVAGELGLRPVRPVEVNSFSATPGGGFQIGRGQVPA